MAIVSIKVDKVKSEEIMKHYADYQKDNFNEYIIFFADFYNTQISIFRNNKDESLKVVFNGKDALKEAKIFDESATIVTPNASKAKEAEDWVCLDTQIGSDEVGTGDFFGPIVVCAAYISKDDIKDLRILGVDDSKKLNDEQIKAIAPILISKYDYSLLSVDNEKYNELTAKGLNMNAIKAKLHNQALLNLKIKHCKCANVFLDQFVNPTKYYEYVSDAKEVLRGVTFRMKGESAYPSVAVGSIIARYTFITKIEKLSEQYKMDIPFGASDKVDLFAKKFVEKYGIEELNKVVKMNFINYKKLVDGDNKLL